MAYIRVKSFSKSLGMAMETHVLIPETAPGPKGFKTLWLLHGGGDDGMSWMRNTSIERYARERTLAVVMPSAHLSGYTNLARGGAYYTWVAKELPQYLRRVFPLSSAREDNYIAGNSMGGNGAMKLGLAEPSHFSAIGCFSAAGVTPDQPLGRQWWMTNVTDRELSDKNDLTYGGIFPYGTLEDISSTAISLARGDEKAPHIWHIVGASDPCLAEAKQGRNFYLRIAGGTIRYDWRMFPGGHNWAFWDAHICDFLDACLAD